MNKAKKIVAHRNSLDKLTFNDFGLDRKKNFLDAPICECCGERKAFFPNGETIQQACGKMAFENDYNLCGVFAIKKDKSLVSAIKVGKSVGDVTIITMELNCDYKSIGEYIKGLRLPHYGILVEIESDAYKIITE